MSDIFATYQPPGVYVREEASQVATLFGPGISVVGIVGPSIGYRMHTEAITLSGTTDVRLSKLGVDISSVVVTKANGDPAVVDDDYALTQGDGEDGLPSTSDDTMDIARSGGSTIGDGETVTVFYHYTDPTYFDPFRATNFGQITDAYGEPIDRSTGEIISPLSFAAKFAFDNGASSVLTMACAGTASLVDLNSLHAAYNTLLAQEDISILVPLLVGITGTDNAPGSVLTATTAVATHVNAADGDGIYRTAVVGYERTVTIDPSTAAGAADSKRVMVVYPNRLNYYNSVTQQTTEISGYYLAAAYAGRMASQDVQVPITRKAIYGFSGLPGSVLSAMTRSAKDGWSSSGVAVTEVSPTKGLVCRHGTSSNPASVLTREISLIRARDTMLNSMVSSIDASDIIGSAIMEETPARIKGIVQGVLENLVQQDTIVGYGTITVRQTSLDPTVIEVKFDYQPAYPLNYISIVFAINTTTGLIADNTTAAA